MIHSINLTYDYPVKWSKFQTLRDLIQNFYDALGYENFHSRFQYEYAGETITLKAKGCSFNYEWLLHIGASTKRGQDKNYAGYFGEGFKIAALCATRDYSWFIRSGSKDWVLEIVIQSEVIDGQKVELMAYDITTDVESSDTWLSIGGVLEEDQALFESTLMSFYYPENNLIGDLIWADSNASIYIRSDSAKPNGFPLTHKSIGEGLVFLNYQVRGTIEFPIVICKHNFVESDRERKNLYLFDVIDIVSSIIYGVPPDVAYELLVIFRSKWYKYPKSKEDIFSWNPVVKKLIRILSKSKEQTELFRKEYPNLLVAHQVRGNDYFQLNRRRHALAWKRVYAKNQVLVQDGFELLDYFTIEEWCRLNGGMEESAEPSEIQKKYICLLNTTTQMLLADFFVSNQFPPCFIMKDNQSSFSGKAHLQKSRMLVENSEGITIKFSIRHIFLDQFLLQKGKFNDALSTYIHELCHMFGGDSSANFSKALTCAMGIIFGQALLIDLAAKEWEMIE